MLPELQSEIRKKMNHTIDVVRQELASVRTGRANPEILNPVLVDYYGSPTALKSLANMSAADAQMIVVTPFDPSVIKAVQKAIASSDLGLNPSVDGNLIRVPVPVLTQERRKELVKHVKKLGEDGKVALRNVRRDFNDRLKKLEKDKVISQDDEKRAHSENQGETDEHVKAIDALVKQKEEELMTV